LDALQARDARLTAYQLDYIVTGVMDAPPIATWEFPDFEDTYEIPLESLGARELEVIYHEQLVVKGAELTFTRELDPALTPTVYTPGTRFPLSYQKWSNVGGELRELTKQPSAIAGPRDTILDVYPLTIGLDNLLAWQRMAIELAHGFGLGTRVVALTAVEEGPQGWHLTGTMRAGFAKDALFEATIDAQHIVTQIRVDGYGDDLVRRLEVWNTGSQTMDGGALAENAMVQASIHPTSDGPQFDPIVTQEYDTTLVSLNLDFHEAEYRRLVELQAPTDATRITWKANRNNKASRSKDYEREEDDGSLEKEREHSDTATENTCGACQEEWISQRDLIGDLECEHGPEHDTSPTCLAAIASGNVICKEHDAVNGNCACYECQGIPLKDPFSLTCEHQLLRWAAWCDLTYEHQAGDECPTTPGDVGVVYQDRETQLTGTEVCDGANGAHVEVPLCGKPMGWGSLYLACRATNCSTVGGWGSATVGVRWECDT